MIKLIKRVESVTIFSENAKKLADFYKEKVGINFTTEAEMGDKGEELYGFDVEGGSGFYIVDHSGIEGDNKDPKRIIVNFEVEKDIESAVKKLDEAGVKKIQDTYHVESYGKIATFEDIDGNYFQLVQVREI